MTAASGATEDGRAQQSHRWEEPEADGRGAGKRRDELDAGGRPQKDGSGFILAMKAVSRALGAEGRRMDDSGANVRTSGSPDSLKSQM